MDVCLFLQYNLVDRELSCTFQGPSKLEDLSKKTSRYAQSVSKETKFPPRNLFFVSNVERLQQIQNRAFYLTAVDDLWCNS